MKNLKKIKHLLLLLGVTTLLHAGDPCPIGYEFYDLGVPKWLDKERVLDGLQSQSMWVGISYKTAKGGAVITRVVKGSNAYKAGLKVKDIIQRMNGKSIQKTQDVSDGIDAKSIGDVLKFELLRSGEKRTINMKIGRKDPLFTQLSRNLHGCNQVRIKHLKPEQKRNIQKKLFVNGKRFNCHNAHRELAKLKIFHGDGGELVMIRGSKRVLLSHVGEKTLCVQSSKYDGANLSKKSLKKLSYELFDDYVQDRYRNP
ncbi:MAG TPA: PDZ domain-containing protein [Campylobacterales bacterium]|nr:PDZ domain-containing protein [Campylobacterales bacterium]